MALGATSCTSPPVDVTGVADAVAVAAGDDHTCTIHVDGTIKCWGDNDSGQLGNGTNADSLKAIDEFGITNATAIAAGSNHTCALVTAAEGLETDFPPRPTQDSP